MSVELFNSKKCDNTRGQFSWRVGELKSMCETLKIQFKSNDTKPELCQKIARYFKGISSNTNSGSTSPVASTSYIPPVLSPINTSSVNQTDIINSFTKRKCKDARGSNSWTVKQLTDMCQSLKIPINSRMVKNDYCSAIKKHIKDTTGISPISPRGLVQTTIVDITIFPQDIPVPTFPPSINITEPISSDICLKLTELIYKIYTLEYADNKFNDTNHEKNLENIILQNRFAKINKDEKPTMNNFFISQPFGSQKQPDFRVSSDGFYIDIECKSGRTGYKPIWNSTYPNDETVYIYTNKRDNDTIIFTGSEKVIPSRLKTELEKYKCSLYELTNNINKITRGLSETDNPYKFEVFGRKMFTQCINLDINKKDEYLQDVLKIKHKKNSLCIFYNILTFFVCLIRRLLK